LKDQYHKTLYKIKHFHLVAFHFKILAYCEFVTKEMLIKCRSLLNILPNQLTIFADKFIKNPVFKLLK